MQPVCEKCGEHQFSSYSLDQAKIVALYCTKCGNIAAAFPDSQFLAQQIAGALSCGSHDGVGHPVVRVKNAEQVFG